MYSDIHELMENFKPAKTFDENFYNLLRSFRLSWAQKSDDYIEFLGNNLTGVYPIRFSIQDEEILYNDIYGIDQKEFQQEVYKVKGIDKNLRTISNATFILLMYTAHMYTNGPKSMSTKLREDAVKEAYYVFIYKVISSRTAHYFKYNVDISIAKAVNERMTNKYLIKRFNSWQEVFEYKTLDLLKGGIHYKRMVNFSTDDCGRVISDMYTKMNDVFKNNYQVLLEVKEANERIQSTSLITQREDDEGIKDITKRDDNYSNYIKGIITSKADFINVEIAELVAGSLNNITGNDLILALNVVTELDHLVIDPKVDTILVNSIEYLTRKKLNRDFIKNLYEIVITLSSFWKSSNFRDRQCKEVKEYFLKLVKSTLKRKVKTIAINVCVAIIVYIVIRGLFGRSV